MQNKKPEQRNQAADPTEEEMAERVVELCESNGVDPKELLKALKKRYGEE